MKKNIKLYLSKFVSPLVFSLTNSILIVSLTTSCAQSVSQSQPEEKPKKPEGQNNSWDEKLDSITADDFFPKININDYYHLIGFEQHEPYITDQLKLQVIKNVLNRVATNLGKISLQIIDKSKKESYLHFKWEYKTKVLYKTYEIKVGS